MQCERCRLLTLVRNPSLFDSAQICNVCQQAEAGCPHYREAQRRKLEEATKDNTSFTGVGFHGVDIEHLRLALGRPIYGRTEVTRGRKLGKPGRGSHRA